MKVTTSVKPALRTRCSSSARCGPSPQMIQRALGARASTAGIESIKTLNPLSGDRRPAVSTMRRPGRGGSAVMRARIAGSGKRNASARAALRITRSFDSGTPAARTFVAWPSETQTTRSMRCRNRRSIRSYQRTLNVSPVQPRETATTGTPANRAPWAVRTRSALYP